MTPAQRQAARLVRAAIRLSSRYAAAGNDRMARRAWNLASRLAYRCGGLSGATWAGGGYGGIVLADGLIAVSPVPLIEAREAA